MREQIEILAALQCVDRQIKEQTGLKQQLLIELKTKAKEIETRKQETESLVTAFTEKEKTRLEKDRTLQEEGKKAIDRRMRMNRIKNAKELQALQREIDQIKQANGELEEEIIKMLEELDSLKAAISAKEQEVAELQEHWKQNEEALQGRISGIEADVKQASQRRQSIAAQIAGDLISRYELIFARRGGMAVVEVAGGICQGCYMNIPPQLWNEIIKSEKVNLCPSCQRILYYRPSAEVEKSA